MFSTVISTSHIDKKLYESKTCSKYFRKKQELQMHVRSHTGEKPHSAKPVTSVFTPKQKLKVHIRVHTGEKLYKCNTCDIVLAQQKV